VALWLSPDHGRELAATVVDATRQVQSGPMPPLSDRDFPRPGHEEERERLLPAVPSEAGVTGHAFSQTQSPDGGGSPVTWSPCRPIHYALAVTGAPATFAQDVELAVTELSAATGLVFVDDGATSERPRPQRASFQPDRYGDRWAPVLIGFTDPANVPDLAGSIAGVAGPTGAVDQRTGKAHYVSGTVYLDVSLLNTPPSGRRERTYVAILRHELGHLVGLNHTDDATQLMYPAYQGIDHFASGDLAGLAALGRGPCAPSV
jgi:hypothetical protein